MVSITPLSFNQKKEKSKLKNILETGGSIIVGTGLLGLLVWGNAVQNKLEKNNYDAYNNKAEQEYFLETANGDYNRDIIQTCRDARNEANADPFVILGVGNGARTFYKKNCSENYSLKKGTELQSSLNLLEVIKNLPKQEPGKGFG